MCGWSYSQWSKLHWWKSKCWLLNICTNLKEFTQVFSTVFGKVSNAFTLFHLIMFFTKCRQLFIWFSSALFWRIDTLICTTISIEIICQYAIVAGYCLWMDVRMMMVDTCRCLTKVYLHGLNIMLLIFYINFLFLYIHFISNYYYSYFNSRFNFILLYSIALK